jgi:peptide/nickel transport system permease protein
MSDGPLAPAPDAPPADHDGDDGIPRRYWRTPLTVVGALILTLVALSAALAPLLAIHDPLEMNPQRLLESPSREHPLGTDEFGRDILSRIIWGARISLYVSASSVALALVLGAALGIVAGLYGRPLDDLISRVLEVVFAFPGVLLALGIVGLLGPSIRNVIIAIGVVYTPVFGRLARATVLSAKERDYVEAARGCGASDLRLVGRHLLPNITAPLIVQTSLSLSHAILAEASLSFLGLGTQPPAASWGTMINTGQRLIEFSPWVAVFPGLAIMLAVLAFNLLGDGLRDALDPRLR